MALKQNAKKLTVVEESTIGTEDRIMLALAPNELDPAWFYQIRGTPEAWGPFCDKTAAEDDYYALDDVDSGVDE